MKKVILLILAAALFGAAFMFYQKSESIKRENAAMQDMINSTLPEYDDSAYEPEPEPEYDPKDLDATPPGVTPFAGSTICMGHWGLQLRQYCDGGDNAVLDIIEGDTQAEAMRTLNMCMDEMVQRVDTYDTDDRPMDSKIPLNETSRKAFACNLTARYGDNVIFNRSSIYYMTKEDMESGNISRLENR